MKTLLPLPECIKHSSFWGPQTLSGGSAPVPPLGAKPPDPLRPLARSSGCATGVSVHKCVMYVEKSSIIDRPRITYRYKNTVLSVALTRWRHSCEFIVMRPHAQSCEIKRGSVRSPSALNVTLPAFAAERRRLLHGARGRSLSPARRALSSKPAGSQHCCRSMGQTDGRTLDRYINLAPHTMREASTNAEVILLRR